MLRVVLEILKFCAIALGAISGFIGTLTDTKDKLSGKITPWGRKIVALIMVSGLIAVATQSIESYLKRAADKEDHERRLADELRTRAILDKAKVIGDEVEKQRESLGRTVEGVERTASSVRSVQSAQIDELVGVYRLAHPLGKFRVEITASYPASQLTMAWSGMVGRESNWIARVRQSSARQLVYLSEPSDPLNPNPETETREYRLFKEPMFVIEFNRTPTQGKSDGKHLLDHGSDLLFRTTGPSTRLWVHLNEPDPRIDQYIGSSTSVRGSGTDKVIDTFNIKSWIDLYGAELIIHLPETAPDGSKITVCHLHFQDDSAPFGGESAIVHLDDSNRRANPFNQPFSNISYVKILGESELGPKPRVVSSR